MIYSLRFFQIKSILYICTCNTVRNGIIITRYRHIGNISHTYVIKRHVFIKSRDTKQNYMYLYVNSTASRFKILQMRQLRKRTYSNTTMFCNKQIKTISILYYINLYTSFVYIIYKYWLMTYLYRRMSLYVIIVNALPLGVHPLP